MEQNIGKANGKESKIPIFPPAEGGRQKSRIARVYIPKSREDWSNERMECEVSNKQTSINDETSEYWHNMLGQKVCIGGVKKGILRYYGKTQFASGIWCGVELDEPVGKNDGTVDGVHYFSCEQNYGIFAPVSKVGKMSLDDATEISNVKSRLPAPKITAKELISRISGPQRVQSSEDILCEKQDDNRMSYFQCYGKRSKLSSSMSDNSNISKLNLNGNNSETSFGGSDSSVFTSDESPEHLAKRSRLSTEEKPRDFDTAFTLKEPFLKPAVSSSSLTEIINDNDINLTFSISSTECDKVESLPSDSDSLDEKTLSFSDLLSKGDGTYVVDSSSATLLERYSSCEDDQISLDLDESLGILTPNQMKDFTICLDTQNSEVIDLETLNIPNSESCDDINEIPEYEEIQGITVEYTPERSTGVQVSLLKNSSNEEHTVVASLEQCVKTPVRTFHKYVDSAPSRLLDKEMEKLIASIDRIPHSETIMNKKSSILDHELSSMELNNKHHSKTNVIPTENNNLISNEYLSKKDKIENCIFLEKSTTEARNECLRGSCFEVPKEGIRSESFVELEGGPDSVGLKDNRPISMHTLESTDTGYQEDVGFDNRSEQGDICEDSNRFSVGSHESCIVLDETEVKNNNRHKVTDSGIVLSGEGDEMFRSNDREAHLLVGDAVQTELNNLHPEQEVNIEQTKHSVKKVDVTEFNKLDRWPMEASDEGCHMFEKTISSTLETTEAYLLNGQNSGMNIETDEPTIKEEIKMDSPTVTCCTAIPISSSSSLIPEKPDSIVSASEQGTPKKEKAHKMQEKSLDIPNNKIRNKTPKKNVISKIKAMIEATTSKTKVKVDQVEPAKKPVKKGRWDAVTSKIAAGLAEEKSKPKAKKEIKSKIDTNLSGARQMSTKRNLGADVKASSSFGTDNASESSLTMRNALEHQRSVCSAAESTEKNSAEGSQTKEKRQTVNASGAPKLQKNSHTLSPLIGVSRRSSSPLLPSDSSTMSDTSKRVTVKQKFQGSNSTLASSPSNTAKKPVASTARKPTSINTSQQKKLPPKAKPKTSQSPGVGKYGGSTQTQGPPAWSTRVELQQEIQRLGTLCEARTKELNHMKMNFRHASLGFDAFVVLFQYLTDELDAFSQPRLVLELEKTHTALEEAEAHLHQYQKEFEEMKAKHSEELCKLEKELNQSHQETIENLNLNHNAEIEELRQCHDKQLAELAETHMKQCQEMEEKHSTALLELKNEHSLQIEELKIFHADQIEAIENSHHETRMELNNQLKELEQQCKDLKHQAKLVEEALQRDTDTKIQWISAKKADLEKEVDSLKTVLDMRRTEIHSLRKENLEMKKELEKLPIAKEKIKMLEAKAEDLQALVNEKIQIERQLSTDHQNLKESYEKESKVNTRLSMENEELMWKLKQNYEANLLLSSFTGGTDTAEKSPLKSPARQSVSLPMFFHSMETTAPESDKMSLPMSSSNVTPCKKLPPLARKCSSPVRTPSFVGASPPGPCSRKCKLDLKAVISPRKQKHKLHHSEKKFPSKETDSTSGHHPSETELLQHSRLQYDESCHCAKDSSPSSVNGTSSDGSQPDCLGEMDHNGVLFDDPLNRSNGSSNEEMYSAEAEYLDESLNFEHYDMLITNQILSKKYKELTHLKKGTEITHEFDDSQHDSFFSYSNSDNHSIANSQNVTAAEEIASSKDFTFNEQHFADIQPQEYHLSFPCHSGQSFHKKSDSWTVSSFCGHTGEPAASTLSHSGCDNSLQSHLQPENSSVTTETHSQITQPSTSQNCSHPLQSTYSQEK